MIDQDLINKASQWAISAVNNCQSTQIDDLCMISNLLDAEIADKLKRYIVDGHGQWETMHAKHRRAIHWHEDSVIEELHNVIDSLTPVLKQKFHHSELNFLGMQIWNDTAEHGMDWHTDNPIITVALQLYLFDQAPQDCGTTFKNQTHKIEFPYIHNHGYLINTNQPPGVLHKISKITPANVNRYLLYCVWSKIKKN